jgi:hypothetical protein
MDDTGIFLLVAAGIVWLTFLIAHINMKVNKLLEHVDLSKEDAAVLAATKNVKDARSKIPPPE